MVEWWCVLRGCAIFVCGMVVEYAGVCYCGMLGGDCGVLWSCVLCVCVTVGMMVWGYGRVGSGGVCYGGVSYCCVGYGCVGYGGVCYGVLRCVALCHVWCSCVACDGWGVLCSDMECGGVRYGGVCDCGERGMLVCYGAVL